MPEISVNGIKTFFREFCVRERKYPAVIFIHGAGQSSECWKFQHGLFELIEHYKFIFIDLPGHGKSEGTGFTTIKAYSEFLHSFIYKLGIEEHVLIGHSMGGRITQVNLIDYPENSFGCILAGTGSRIRVTRYTMETAKRSIENFAKMATENSFSKMVSAEIKTEFRNQLINTHPRTIVNDLIACNEFDTTANISQINTPCYIIAGEDDKLAPFNHSVHLNRLIPDSRIEIIKGAGHFMMLEKPAEFNKIITNFLNFIYFFSH